VDGPHGRKGKQLNLVSIARALASDNGENPEYDRALVEMVCNSTGLANWYADNPAECWEYILNRPMPN
jgi:hypothetical protein